MEYFNFIPEGWIENRENYDFFTIEKAFQDGKILQGFVEKCDSECNLHINLGENILGLIPQNEVDFFSSDEYGVTRADICKNKEHTFVQFKVKEICSKNKIILSRKKASEDTLEWIMQNLDKGMIVRGIVKNIRKYGVFVEIGAGVVGLLHIEDICISRIKTPEERFKVGEKIDIAIKDIDKENKRIVFTYKELLRKLGRKCKKYFRKRNHKGNN